MVLPQILNVFGQHPPLLSKFSECPTCILIRSAKRFLGALGGMSTALFGSQIHPHFRTGLLV
jgi:hypothetical protein